MVLVANPLPFNQAKGAEGDWRWWLSLMQGRERGNVQEDNKRKVKNCLITPKLVRLCLKHGRKGCLG